MDRRRILVIGYYHRKNLGDDVFEHVLINYFQDRWSGSEYTFVTIDDLKTIDRDTTAVIFGGGDLVNDYFFRKIDSFISNKTCPWYAVSIGIPYPQLIQEGYLDRFDYIIHRNQEDKDVLTELYPGRSHWYPDLSSLLPKYHQNNKMIEFPRNRYNSKKIGISLARSIYNKTDPEAYNRMVNNLSKFLSGIATTTQRSPIPTCKSSERTQIPEYELYLLPFCTDEKDNHDDRLINKDVYERIMDYGELDNVHLLDEVIHMDRLVPIFNSFYMTICTRFHAHMFSLLTKTPVLSIYTTRKVENLIEEIGAQKYAYRMETHPTKYYPVDIDPQSLQDRFGLIIDEYDQYKEKMENLHGLYTRESNNLVTKLDNLLFYAPRYVLPDEIDKKALSAARQIANKLSIIWGSNENLIFDLLGTINNKLALIVNSEKNNNNRDMVDELIHGDGAILNYFSDGLENHKDHIIELISYELTGERNSDYHYGLSQKVFTSDYNLFESCKWILGHKYSLVNEDRLEFLDNNLYPLTDRRLNVKFINTNLFQGYHRSGWSFVLHHMEQLHNPKGVIFDSYLDKTFGWEYDFLSLSQVIPYRKPWIGVFHHTPNQEYTDNNLVTVFSKPNFIQSLNCCKGLIVLSKNNQQWIQSKLKELFVRVPVISLIHPTEFLDRNLLFDFDKFKQNPVKKIIQIGAWLRNSYAIYELDTPKELNGDEKYHKYALKGKGMDNYFVSDEDIGDIVGFIKNVACGRKERISGCLIQNKDVNKYLVGLIDNIESRHGSVTVLENISNEQYDELLRDNIVFINLVDAAAVNTILECIVRNTPILVNRLPATEEYLGKDYPLFYDSLDHANDLLTDIRNIKKAHKYLCRMPKDKFSIDYFLKSLVQSEVY